MHARRAAEKFFRNAAKAPPPRPTGPQAYASAWSPRPPQSVTPKQRQQLQADTAELIRTCDAEGSGFTPHTLVKVLVCHLSMGQDPHSFIRWASPLVTRLSSEGSIPPLDAAQLLDIAASAQHPCPRFSAALLASLLRDPHPLTATDTLSALINCCMPMPMPEGLRAGCAHLLLNVLDGKLAVAGEAGRGAAAAAGAPPPFTVEKSVKGISAIDGLLHPGKEHRRPHRAAAGVGPAATSATVSAEDNISSSSVAQTPAATGPLYTGCEGFFRELAEAVAAERGVSPAQPVPPGEDGVGATPAQRVIRILVRSAEGGFAAHGRKPHPALTSAVMSRAAAFLLLLLRGRGYEAGLAQPAASLATSMLALLEAGLREAGAAPPAKPQPGRRPRGKPRVTLLACFRLLAALPLPLQRLGVTVPPLRALGAAGGGGDAHTRCHITARIDAACVAAAAAARRCGVLIATTPPPRSPEARAERATASATWLHRPHAGDADHILKHALAFLSAADATRCRSGVAALLSDVVTPNAPRLAQHPTSAVRAASALSWVAAQDPQHHHAAVSLITSSLDLLPELSPRQSVHFLQAMARTEHPSAAVLCGEHRMLRYTWATLCRLLALQEQEPRHRAGAPPPGLAPTAAGTHLAVLWLQCAASLPCVPTLEADLAGLISSFSLTCAEGAALFTVGRELLSLLLERLCLAETADTPPSPSLLLQISEVSGALLRAMLPGGVPHSTPLLLSVWKLAGRALLLILGPEEGASPGGCGGGGAAAAASLRSLVVATQDALAERPREVSPFALAGALAATPAHPSPALSQWLEVQRPRLGLVAVSRLLCESSTSLAVVLARHAAQLRPEGVQEGVRDAEGNRRAGWARGAGQRRGLQDALVLYDLSPPEQRLGLIEPCLYATAVAAVHAASQGGVGAAQEPSVLPLLVGLLWRVLAVPDVYGLAAVMCDTIALHHRREADASGDPTGGGAAASGARLLQVWAVLCRRGFWHPGLGAAAVEVLALTGAAGELGAEDAGSLKEVLQDCADGVYGRQAVDTRLLSLASDALRHHLRESTAGAAGLLKGCETEAVEPARPPSPPLPVSFPGTVRSNLAAYQVTEDLILHASKAIPW